MKTEFSIKGFHIDLRIQVMPMPALRKYVAELAEFGLNTLLIEWEAAYPYDKHAIISSEYAYTREEVESFIAYCGRLGIDVIPLQQCFGHTEYILRHERYADLRESSTDFCQVCPLKAADSFTVFRELLADIASTHPSKYIHIGGDETYLLGHCEQCRAKAQREGKSRLYVDYFKEIARCVTKLGRRPVLWADMLLKHPEAVDEMPKECVFVDWNYGWEPSHFGDLSRIEGNGFKIWGAAALRAHPDNHSLTSWQRRFHNIRDFIPHARNQGYTGMLLTSWSTSGVYGYEWDQGGEVVELHPIRRVYPLSGFRILLAAYVEALKQSNPIDPQDFVKEYAAERFGLSPHDGDKLWQALTLDATLIQPGMDVGPINRKAQKSKRLLAAIHPNRHENEFEHLRLMADLREYHMRFKRLESEIQSPQFSSAQIRQKTRMLEKLLKESITLDQRFMELNTGFLHESAIAEEAEAHTKKLRKLYDRLSRAGRRPRETVKAEAHDKRNFRWSGTVNGALERPPQERSPVVAAE
jgi:hypothetical protein